MQSNPTEAPREGVQVEQCDRDAAADYYEATKSHRTDEHIIKLIRAGGHGHVLAQAFAKHRQDHPRATPAQDELVKALEVLEAANEALCAVRSQAVYAMMELESREQLVALDDARQYARTVLSNTLSKGTGE